MREAQRARVVGAVVVSAALHAVLAHELPPRRLAPRVSAPAEVMFEIVDAQPAHEERRAAAEVVSAPVVTRPAPGARAKATAVAVDESVQPVEVAKLASVAVSRAVEAEVKPAWTDLSPRAVALSAHESSAGAARSCAALHADAGMQCEDGEAARVSDAHARLQASLSAAAGSGLRSSADAKPKLTKSSDGSYAFEGTGFTATIERDGAVQLEDKSVVQVAPIPIGGTFDLMDAIEGGLLGRELHATEKRWVLEQTASLRAELAARELERLRMAGRTGLEQELRRLAGDTTRSLDKSHADIFALWDDCAADEHGTVAQELIERFVQREMPEGSAKAFTREELEALNRKRVSARRFDPYGLVDAGAQPG